MKIKINDVDYNVDLDKAVSLGVITPIIKRRKGQYYEYGRQIYILAIVGLDKVSENVTMALVGIENGGRLNDNVVPIVDPYNITDEEWVSLSPAYHKEFKLVEGTVDFVRPEKKKNLRFP